MQLISLVFPLLYLLFVVGLCTYLLMRGITHLFIGLFAGSAVLEMIPRLGFLFLQQAPGGLSANSRYIPFLSLFGFLGAILTGAAFLSLAAFLLRTQNPVA